jgi:sugar lactone lactonase YvrE
VRTLVLTAAAAVVAAACSHETRPDVVKPGPAIDSFSEPSVVTAVAPIGATVYVGTSLGLDRWDAEGKRRHLGAAEGVAGAPVRALALAPAGKLWFATDAGVGRWDVEAEKATMMPAPPPPLGPAVTGLRVLAVDKAGGAWVGGTGGLFHVDADGWKPTAFRAEVTALYAAPNGELWLGTRDGVVERNVGGVFTNQREGCTLKNVVAIAEGPDGATVAVGDDGEGYSRIAAFLEGEFTTYRLSNDAHIAQAAHRLGGTVLYGGGRLYTLLQNDTVVVGLHRNGVHLVHVAGKHKKSPYTVGLFDVPTPPDATALASDGAAIFVGTRSKGTERIVFEREPGVTSWLRARELVVGARSLFVACADRNECYVATGGMTAWRYDGKSFAPLAIGAKPAIVLAVVRDPKGQVLALYREPSERMLHVARLEKGTFVPRSELKVETPSGASVLAFARFAGDGLLWLGLQYLDEDGDPRPYGVAIVDPALNAVSYHHEGKNARRSGVLPIPNDVVDVAFMDDEVWLASASGAARLKGGQVHLWTEADELRSEIVHGVVTTEGGLVYIASSSGVGEYDGKHWSYPPPLAFIVNGIARGSDGRLWLATDRGLVVYDGKKTDRFDRRAGLADDRMLDVVVDYLGRVWARSPEGLSILTPT